MKGTFLLLLMELILSSYGIIAYFSKAINIINKYYKSIMVVFGISLVSLFEGGGYALLTVIKILSFFVIICIGYYTPRKGIKLLFLITFVFLTAKGFDGEFATKWSMAPFFLLASGLVYLRKNNNLMSLLILLCGVVLEAAQMIWVDSRSALIMLIVALLTSLLPLNIYGKIWRFLGRYVPFLYLILLIWLLIGFASGEFYVNPTASNIERSALAFWSYKMMPDYIFSGPGADEFFKNVNDALISVERGRDDDGIDPHSFLLSYWVGLGVLPMIAIYSVWWKLFEKINRASQIESFYKRISFSYFATYAVISFTLAAPDSFFRMVVGIALGVVISNTHDH